MARPRGEVRLALKLAAAEEPGTARDLAARAQVGFAAARFTIRNMVASGELAPVRRLEVPWRCAPIRVYAVAQPRTEAPPADCGEALQRVISAAWR